MSKEIYISSTPQETRLAIVEKEELTEIYYERENEYTLAGSIYNGKVTRVLPGMQSSFVDIGLERDAFLYITDFMEEAGDSADFDGEGRSKPREPRLIEGSTEAVRPEGGEGRGDRGGRDRGGRDRGRGRGRGDRDRGPREPRAESSDLVESRPVPISEDDEFLAAPREDAVDVGEGAPGADGSRRWRGRRGRRRGGRSGEPQVEGTVASAQTSDEGFDEPVREAAPEREFEPRGEGRSGRDRDRGRRDRDRGSRGGREDRSRGPRADMEASASDGPQPEPFILPGESLGKYRNDPPPAESAKPATDVIIPRASTEFVVSNWDGGLVLPGETLRPRGGDRSESRDSGRDRHEGRGEGRGRREERDLRRGRYESQKLEPSAAVLPAVTSQHDVEETRPFSDDAPASETQEFEQSIAAQAEAANEEIYESQTDAAPVEDVIAVPVAEAVEELHETIELQETTTEYEPGDDASASFRVDPAGTREFRQASPVDVSSETDEFTTVQPTGEMISDAPVFEATHEPVAPIEHQNAVQEVTLADAENTPLTFAPGEGELEEELLDDEGDEVGVLQASAYDDEMEEETLEVAADLGSMIEDMSIDSITDSEPEDEEEYDDEEMEEDELGADEQLAGSDFSEADEESFAEGESFEEEFDENGEPKPVVESTARSERSDRPRREGGRDRGRGGRDRGGRDRNGGGGDRGGRSRDSRGMAGSRAGGRSRQSAQLTDLPAISDLLKPGQEVLVQIAKEPIAKKGARITSHIALPGRFLVFMPTVSHVGVSRKIESDGERRRLKEILLSEKGEASGGFIVRTAASGASEEELRSDLRFLLNLWADIKNRSESSKSPALIYHDLNLIERILRDQVTDNFSAIWVDTEAEYERVLRFLQRFQPSLIRRVKLYSKETPLFEQFGITAEINKALAAKVWLKSGGSIVINQTEALVAIDINTGKFVGKTARLEDTILKTNLDAIPEIVRQIRLRDLGGIIIIDFIDMDERKNRNKVMAVLEEELKKDRAPSKVLQFNDFGLVAITRKRVKQSLERTLSTTCSICAGTGMVKAPITVCNEIYIELRKLHKHLDKGDIMLRVNPEVVKQLKLNGGKWLQDMEEMSGKTILVKSDPGLHPEQFDLH